MPVKPSQTKNLGGEGLSDPNYAKKRATDSPSPPPRGERAGVRGAVDDSMDMSAHPMLAFRHHLSYNSIALRKLIILTAVALAVACPVDSSIGAPAVDLSKLPTKLTLRDTAVNDDALTREQIRNLPPPKQGAVNFVKDIQPIFAEHCYGCHGPKKQEALFRLDAKEIALKGGELGPAIVPGKS